MEDQILYDLIVYEEWMREPQVLHQVGECFWQHRGPLFSKIWKVTRGQVSSMMKTLKTQFRFQTSFGCPPQHLITLQNNKLSWNLALSCDGMLVAILQDNKIEIRTVSDNFSSVIGNFAIHKDGLPQWRKIAWNDRNSLLAYSNSFGDVHVFHLRTEQMCLIPQPQRSGLNVPGTLSEAVALLKFVPCKEEEWDELLYVATYQGYLNCYYLKENVSTFKEKCSLSLLPYHPYGISSMEFDWKNQLLIAAGNYGEEPYVSDTEPCYGSHCGISVWRLLMDTPYFSLLEDHGKGFKKVSTSELITSIVMFRRKEAGYLKRGIYKLELSPDATMLLALHLDGRISLWHVPSFRLARSWHKSEQPNSNYNSNAVAAASLNNGDDVSNVIDMRWWSEKALVLARGNGAVTVSSCETLLNLLGESPERFDYWPLLSDGVNGHVLVLECERTVTTPGEKANGVAKKWLSEKDEEDLYSFRSRLKEISKQVLYFLTDAERFLPAIQPPQILTNTYRLVCLKSTTPEELYARKIDLEHYGDALDLAQRFDLNTDLVYQRQWRKKPVTIITIHDYLTKIKDRYWVLDECLLRIPEDYDSMEHLLKYGLLGTNWEIVQVIDEKDEEELKYFMEPEMDDEGEETEKKLPEALSPKQLRLCRYRWQFLQYLDRLSTYEIILGNSLSMLDSFKAREKFSAKYFSHFRSCNIVHQALEYARDEDSIALEHLLSYYGKDILPHWLPVLSNFPETADVEELDPVIPEIGETVEDPEILPWHEMFHRDVDWVEHRNVLQQIHCNMDEDIGSFIYEFQPELQEFRNCQSKKVLHSWFVKRTYEIEEISKQVDKACDFLELGVKRGITGLLGLKSNLETLRILTYEVNIDSSLGLDELMALPHLSKLKLLMSKSTEQNFVLDFKRFVMPYLSKIGIKSMANKNKLMHQFLVDIAKADLTCCFELFSSSSLSVTEPVIADIGLLMKLAMDCIFVCKRDDQLDLVFSIVECLPNREEDMPKEIVELHNQLDILEDIVKAAEILESHSYPLTIAYIRDNKDDENIAEDIIRELIKSTVLKNPAATPAEWNKLLDNLITLVKDTFKCVAVKRCHEMFVKGLLQSGSKVNINIAQELLTPSRHGSLIKTKEQYLRSALYILKYDVSVNLVVETATEYFNSAAFLGDASMDLARLCLALISDKPNVIEEELDLIESLSLLEEFNIPMLPLQVRLCPDKFDIIEKCLKEKNLNYKKYEKVLRLGYLLRICGDEEKERNGEIRIKVADKAFEQRDYVFASNVCHQLIEDRCERAWDICRRVGICSEYSNFTSREKMLSFAMTFCPATEMEGILNANTLLKTQILYDKLRFHVNENLGEDDEVNGCDESLVKSTTKKTMRLLSSMKESKWIEQAIKWTNNASSAVGMELKECDLSGRSQCHPFYETVCGKNYSSKYDFDEFTSLLEGKADNEKLFNELMLRSQKLSERRAHGEIVENTDEVLSCLANIEFSNEDMMSFTYLLSLSSVEDVQKFFDKQKRTKHMLRFASYYYALQLYGKQNKLIMKSLAPVYLLSHRELAENVLNKVESGGDKVEESEASKLLLYMKTLSDMQQAEMLQNLGKGVDVERFSHDDSYKKETILGLAMNLNDEIVNICFQLAEKYQVEIWEVMLAHVEFLFTESGLKGNAIRDELKKWDIEEKLKAHGDEVFDRLSRFVYPEINGTEHNKLLLFYVLLLNCTSPTTMLGESLNLDAHVKILKKVKAAAQQMDYKALVHGDSPLDVIQSVIRENNVHLLAKISSKIPKKDGSFITPQKVFLVYLKKAYWKPERDVKTVDWVHHFETYQKMLPKLDLADVVDFADHITFTEEAFTLLTVEIRLDITSRLLKFVRQTLDPGNMKGAKKSDRSASVNNSSILQDLEKSLKHLKSLQSQTFLDLLHSFNVSHQSFAKQYDLSGGNNETIRRICIAMFKNIEPPHLISQILSLGEHSIGVKDVFKGALKELLDDVQRISNSSNLRDLINGIKASSDSDNDLIIVDDFLEVIRPFCSSQDVDAQLKSEVLRLLKDSFQLSGEDVFLLMWLQTDSIISSKWDFKITSDDISSPDKRYKLFCKLLSDSSSSAHTAGLEELLSTWPVDDPSDNDTAITNPWVQLILKRIDIEEYSLVLHSFSVAEKRATLSCDGYNTVYLKLKELGKLQIAFKVMLSSKFPECSDMVLTDLLETKELDLDNELLELLVNSNDFYRLVEAPFYAQFVCNLLSRNGNLVHTAIYKLQEEGFYAEAGTIYMKLNEFHPSFCTFYNTLGVIKRKLNKKL